MLEWVFICYIYVSANSAQMLNQLGTSVSSELDGNPPLWVTRRRTGTKDDIYVNNAKVIATRSNLVYTNLNSRKQVMNGDSHFRLNVISKNYRLPLMVGHCCSEILPN